jgi:hypothetical protein
MEKVNLVKYVGQLNIAMSQAAQEKILPGNAMLSEMPF